MRSSDLLGEDDLDDLMSLSFTRTSEVLPDLSESTFEPNGLNFSARAGPPSSRFDNQTQEELAASLEDILGENGNAIQTAPRTKPPLVTWTSSESSSSTSTLPNTASNTPPLNPNSAYQDGYNKHGYEEEDFRVAVGQGMFDGKGLMSDLDQMLDEELQVRERFPAWPYSWEETYIREPATANLRPKIRSCAWF